jgi:nucleotide-binding universal stress UspA family protein
MSVISTIIVPNDGTEMSDKAFGKAVELVKALGSRLILLDVLKKISVPSPMLMLGNDKVLMKRARRNIRRQLEKGWDKLMEIKNHEIEDQNLSLSWNFDTALPLIRSCDSQKITRLISL